MGDKNMEICKNRLGILILILIQTNDNSLMVLNINIDNIPFKFSR